MLLVLITNDPQQSVPFFYFSMQSLFPFKFVASPVQIIQSTNNLPFQQINQPQSSVIYTLNVSIHLPEWQERKPSYSLLFLSHHLGAGLNYHTLPMCALRRGKDEELLAFQCQSSICSKGWGLFGNLYKYFEFFSSWEIEDNIMFSNIPPKRLKEIMCAPLGNSKHISSHLPFLFSSN